MRGKGRGWRGRDNKQINNGIILIFSAIKEIREAVLKNKSRVLPRKGVHGWHLEGVTFKLGQTE